MSERIDLLTYLEAKLRHALVSNPKSPNGYVLHRIIYTTENISDEHFNQLAPFLPHWPKLMLAVNALNNGFVFGNSSPASFHEYVGALAASLQAA